MSENTIYHIYAKDRCLYNCLEEKEFNMKWEQLNAMVGLMHTDYDINDLSYEKLPPGLGATSDGEPGGEDSY